MKRLRGIVFECNVLLFDRQVMYVISKESSVFIYDTYVHSSFLFWLRELNVHIYYYHIIFPQNSIIWFFLDVPHQLRDIHTINRMFPVTTWHITEKQMNIFVKFEAKQVWYLWLMFWFHSLRLIKTVEEKELGAFVPIYSIKNLWKGQTTLKILKGERSILVMHVHWK